MSVGKSSVTESGVILNCLLTRTERIYCAQTGEATKTRTQRHSTDVRTLKPQAWVLKDQPEWCPEMKNGLLK